MVISKMETTTAHGAMLVPYAKIVENDYNLSETSLHATMIAAQLIGAARLVALWRKDQKTGW